jgi:IS4 transposase
MELFSRNKNNNKPLIRQIIDLVPKDIFNYLVSKYQSDKGCSKYKTYDQFVSMSFGQLNKSITLSDISTGIGISKIFIKDLGLEQSPARSTMSDGNKKRNWQVFEALYYQLLNHYEKILVAQNKRSIIEEVKDKTIKLIDSTTISLCLSMFNWAKYRTAKGGIKVHTCWDDALMIPDIVNITEAKLHDSKGFESLVFPKDTIIVEDRAYFDFTLMLSRIKAKNVFVTRLKKDTIISPIEETDLPENADDTILKDEIIKLSSKKAEECGISEKQLRLVHVYKKDENKVIEIITNQLEWEAETIAALYKKRWDIELFFKAMKQNLQIKAFIGTSKNAVKSQIYIALICYLLLQLIKRTVARKTIAFSNFVERIRMCLPFYLSIKYICNHISEGARRVKRPPPLNLFPKYDLFSEGYGQIL